MTGDQYRAQIRRHARIRLLAHNRLLRELDRLRARGIAATPTIAAASLRKQAADRPPWY
jgi:hypothetical protein